MISSGANRPCSQAWKKPKRPSSTVGGPVKPSLTSCAAETAACAAHPQCMRLTVPPVRLDSMMPDAIEAVTPSTLARPASSSPSSMPAATAEPIAPAMEVAC